MIRLILLCLFVAGGVWLGVNLHQEQGMVLIAAGGKSYEMSLWVGALILIIAFLLLYLIMRVVRGLFNLKEWFSELGQKRRHDRAREKTNQGLIELAEGNWHWAEKHLIQGARDAEVPLLNYLAAARAAQESGDDRKRDHYLSLAHDATSGTDLAVGLTQAELQYTHGQYEQCLATLKHLRTIAPKHPYVLKLLKNIYVHLRDWGNLLALLPLLKKQKCIEDSEAHHLERLCYCQLISQLSQKDKLDDFWRAVPKNMQLDSQITNCYAKRLIESKHFDDAETALKNSLKKHWDDSLVLLYGHLRVSHPPKMLSTAEGWLKHHPDNAALLLTCGRLAVQNELWGKAQRYLEASLSLTPYPEAYALLGVIHEKMGKTKVSADYFRKGLLKAAHLDEDQDDPLLLEHLKD